MHRLTNRLRESLREVGSTFGNAALRRLMFASLGSMLGNWGYYIALFVYAYDQGGASAVGLVTVIRMIPAAIAAPFTAGLADRFDRKLVMVVSDVARAVFMLAAAGVIWADGPTVIVYAFVGLTAIAGTAFAPAQSAALPTLARSPAELTAANVSFSTLYEAVSFIGPALGGLLLLVMSVPLVFAVNGASFVWSGALLLGLHIRKGDDAAAPEQPEPEAVAESDTMPAREAPKPRRGSEVTAGLKAIVSVRELRLLVGLYSAQTLAAGAIDVLIVVMAFSLLGAGQGAIGYFHAAMGVGGLVGGFIALLLATRGRLASDFGIGLALYGLPLVVIGLVAATPVALVALAIVGVGNSLIDINALTIMQRTVPDRVLGRALGVLDGILWGAIGVGALITPALLDLVGTEAMLIGTGLTLPLLTVAAARTLRSLDRRAEPEHVGLLRGIEMLSLLPEAALERLARSLSEIQAVAGDVIICEGEVGDRFYVISDGKVEVVGKTLSRGDSFGEVALLRDVPRTATVTALTNVTLYALDRDVFVAAVTGHAPAHASAEAVIASHLTGSRGEWAQVIN